MDRKAADLRCIPDIDHAARVLFNYDVAYAYNPSGTWTRDHQMSLAGRRNGFERDDILQFAASIGVKKRRALEILDKVSASVRDWGKHAEAAGVAPRDVTRIGKTFGLNLTSGQ